MKWGMGSSRLRQADDDDAFKDLVMGMFQSLNFDLFSVLIMIIFTKKLNSF